MYTAPTCAKCGTDEYLVIHKFTPTKNYQRREETAQGSILSMEKEDAVASFHCMKCAHFNGHNVPDGWKPRKLSSDQIAAILGGLGKQQGFSFPDPHRRNVYDDEGRVKAQQIGSFQ